MRATDTECLIDVDLPRSKSADVDSRYASLARRVQDLIHCKCLV